MQASGTVGELHQKHRLALNLRRLDAADAASVAPRSYFIAGATARAMGGNTRVRITSRISREPRRRTMSIGWGKSWSAASRPCVRLRFRHSRCFGR